MATYNKNKPKSNVAKSAKKSSFKFKWWMAVVGVGIIALVGIVVLRFSHAGTNIVGKMEIYAGTADRRFYAHYWACRDRGYPFTTVEVTYYYGSHKEFTNTGLEVYRNSNYNLTSDYYNLHNFGNVPKYSIQADMRVTNYLDIYIWRLRPDKNARSNPVRVGTIPYCN